MTVGNLVNAAVITYRQYQLKVKWWNCGVLELILAAGSNLITHCLLPGMMPPPLKGPFLQAMKVIFTGYNAPRRPRGTPQSGVAPPKIVLGTAQQLHQRLSDMSFQWDRLFLKCRGNCCTNNLDLIALIKYTVCTWRDDDTCRCSRQKIALKTETFWHIISMGQIIFKM